MLAVIKKKKSFHFSESASSGQKLSPEKIHEPFLPSSTRLCVHGQDVFSVSTTVLGTLFPSSDRTLVLRAECSHGDDVLLQRRPQLAPVPFCQATELKVTYCPRPGARLLSDQNSPQLTAGSSAGLAGATTPIRALPAQGPPPPRSRHMSEDILSWLTSLGCLFCLETEDMMDGAGVGSGVGCIRDL